jgi:hypothetical protein
MQPMLSADPLKLVAFDEDDLAVISTHLQDAEVTSDDMVYLPRERRFVLVLGRFDWCAAQTGATRRRQAGLHFERVLGVQHTRFDQADGKARSLIAIRFEPTRSPAGLVTLRFADGSAVRLEVECLEAAMKDLGPVWSCEAAPLHIS